jgi:hypothetical protein
MYRIKIFIACAVLLSTQHSSWAKYDKSLWSAVEVGCGWGFADFGSPHYVGCGSGGAMRLVSSTYKLGFYLWPQTSLGAGFSAVNYYRPDLRLQVMGFADVRHELEHYPNTFAYIDVGIPLATSDPVLSHSNFLTNIGAGYKLMFTKRMSINIAAEYSAFFYAIDENDAEKSRSRHSLSLVLGWEF